MTNRVCSHRLALLGTVIAGAVAVATTAAVAGGIAVREQSAQFQGSSFAGAAAGGGLSSSFWNSAAIGEAGWGLLSESHQALILPDASVTTLPGTVVPPGTGPIGEDVDIGRIALVGASYAAYRLSNTTVVGIAINAPFGLGVEVDDPFWAGQYHGRSAKVFSLNANPMVAYNVMPGLSIGVGAQIQYAKAEFKANPGALAPNHPSSGFDVDDIGFGGTAGVLWQPVPGTSIGLGYRSPVRHKLEGDSFIAGNFANLGFPLGAQPFLPFDVEAEITLPEMVTLSIRQALTPTTRVLGTIEWSNWSRFKSVDIVATSQGGIQGLAPLVPPILPGQVVSRFDFNWHDGWLFALGGEYDWSPNLTLRAGAAYEISPIRNADERFTLITDSDRVWVSLGATYKYSESLTFDLAYTHIFFDDAPIDRDETVSFAALPILAKAEQSVDIIALSIKTKWGAAPEPLK